MSKVTFFSTPVRGHVNPTLPLVEKLVNQGEQVTYYSGEKFREEIEKTGASFRGYPFPRTGPVNPPFPNYVKLAQAILSYTEQVLPELITETRKEQADYIIHDSVCFWGWAVAKKLAVPAVCSMPTLGFNTQVIRGLTRHSGIPGGQLAGTIITNAFSALKVWGAVRRLRRTHGLDLSLTKILNVVINRSDLNIIYTSKEFQPFAEKFDQSYRFVGAMIPEPAEAAESPLDGADRKIIYVSMGTVRTDRADFYRACIAAFRDAPYLVILSTGKEIAVSDLGPIPDHFIVRQFVPWQLEALRKAELFITHGGMNSVMEALFYGVPMLLLPEGREHYLISRRTEELGAGRILQRWELAADKIREIAEQVMQQESYKAAAHRLSQSLVSAGGLDRAVQEIADFKRRFVEKSQGHRDQT